MMGYVEVWCNNEECKADLGYGAYRPNWKEQVKKEFPKCKHCGSEDINACITRG